MDCYYTDYNLAQRQSWVSTLGWRSNWERWEGRLEMWIWRILKAFAVIVMLVVLLNLDTVIAVAKTPSF